MPLRDIILRSRLDTEDTDLLETLFNQCSVPGETASQRQARAQRLVDLFVDGERDREKLVRFLASTSAQLPSPSVARSASIEC